MSAQPIPVAPSFSRVESSLPPPRRGKPPAAALRWVASLLLAACSGGGGAAPGPNPGPELSVIANDQWLLVSWAVVPRAQDYRVYVGPSAGFAPHASRLAVTTTDTAATVVGLSNGTETWVAVTAMVDSAEGPPSWISATPVALGAPRAPAQVTAVSGDGRVRLDWADVDGATGYLVYRWSGPAVATSPANLVTSAEQSDATITGLGNGTETWFVVTTVNTNGESAPSASIAVTPGTSGAPPAPGLLQAAPGDGVAYLSWPAVERATSYNLYVTSSSPVRRERSSLVGNVLSTSARISGLTNGTAAWFAVSAVNGTDESALSPEATTTPQRSAGGTGGRPNAPTNLRAIAIGTTAALSWGESSGAVFYYVYAGPTPQVTRDAAHRVGWTTSTNGTLAGLRSGSTYYFVVTAVNLGGESAASNEVMLALGGGNSQPWRPNHGTYVGTWQTNLFDTRITIAYYANLDSYQIWWQKVGNNFWGQRCTYEGSLTRPVPMGPNNTFYFRSVDPEDPAIELVIEGRFTSRTEVVGTLSDRNRSTLWGCNPSVAGSFGAAWQR